MEPPSSEMKINIYRRSSNDCFSKNDFEYHEQSYYEDMSISDSFADQSRESKNYTLKYELLLQYYNNILKLNGRIRHRIYHVKKEINHLRQLKRVLCERLLCHNAVIMDSNLEIPDKDSGLNLDKAAVDTTSNNSNQSTLRKRKHVESKKREVKVKPSSKEAKMNIIALIDNIVANTNEDSKLPIADGSYQPLDGLHEKEEKIISQDEILSESDLTSQIQSREVSDQSVNIFQEEISSVYL